MNPIASPSRFAATRTKRFGLEASSRRCSQNTDKATVVQDGDWIRWIFAAELPNARLVSVDGIKNRDGTCTYVDRGTPTVPDFSAFTLYREVAHNTVACILEFEVANLSQQELELYAGEPGDASKVEGLPSGSGSSGGGEALLTNSSVWFRTAWEDPFEIDVNTLTVYLTFSYNGSCVTGSSGHVAEWAWFTASDWFQVSSSGPTGGYNCTRANTQASGGFGNWTWNNDNLYTYTNHNNTTVYGYYNGSIARTYNLTKGGEDAALLSTDLVCSWENC